jgi:hypothetical protein
MGVYELVEGKEVNGRGVWQVAGGKGCWPWGCFMYYASSKKWYVSNRADMEVEKCAGWMTVASTALAPDQITETWQVSLGFKDGVDLGWVDAPKVRTLHVVLRQRERQQAMAAARGVRDIRVEGQEQGDHQHRCQKALHRLMGLYELVEGKEVNGRGVWQMAGGRECFMYYGSYKSWFICSGKAAMEAGKGVTYAKIMAGQMGVASTALTPDQITDTWKVSDGTAWLDAPKVRAHVCTAEEKRAASERLEQERQHAMAAARMCRLELVQEEQHDSSTR